MTAIDIQMLALLLVLYLIAGVVIGGVIVTIYKGIKGDFSDKPAVRRYFRIHHPSMKQKKTVKKSITGIKGQ